MKYKIFNDDDILLESFRAKVIKEITDPENVLRKTQQVKKNEVYKDQIKKWVIEALVCDGLKPETIASMSNRATNVSICKKIVNKLARTYNGTVIRTADDPKSQTAIDSLAQMLNVNHAGKKADKFRYLHKQTMWQVVPELEVDEGKYKLKLKNLAPFQYDVIEDAFDHEKARVVILTDFIERNRAIQFSSVAASDGNVIVPSFLGSQNDGKDQIIADSPEDAGTCHRTFIWWSEKYHFTTDEHGKVIQGLSPENGLNPIQELPFVNIALDQDGEFWVRGGDDLIDSTILINVLLTDMNSIAYMQGYGQLVVTGKNPPEFIEGGPKQAIVINQDVGDPNPTVTYISANPPLDTWLKIVEQYVALLLSTNGLSPSTVANKLDATSAASGIAMLIEQSEATENIEDIQSLFAKSEHELWEVICLWQNVLFEQDALCDEFKQIGTVPSSEVQVKFTQVRTPISETDKLNNLQLRKDLGINTMLDLIMMDNPDMTKEEAEKKLLEINKLKLQNMSTFMGAAIQSGQSNSQDQSVDQGATSATGTNGIASTDTNVPEQAKPTETVQ